jgi:chromosomal replication initiation ATPase DnaA
MTLEWCTKCGRYFDEHRYYDPVPEVVRLASILWNVPVQQLLSPSRKAAVDTVRAHRPTRRDALVLYHRFDMTLADIGAELDRDHTTILHGIRRADPDRVTQLTDAVNEQ